MTPTDREDDIVSLAEIRKLLVEATHAAAQSPPSGATACYADWSTADLAAQRKLWLDEKNRITARAQELDRLIARLTLALDARLKTGGPSASG